MPMKNGRYTSVQPKKKAAAKKTASPRRKAASTPAAKQKKDTVPKKKPGPMAKHDYPLAQELYVEGVPTDPNEPDGDKDWLTLKEIAERLDIPYVRLREQSSKGRWSELRSRYQVEAARDRQKRRIEQLGTQSIEFDSKSLDIARMGQRLVNVRLAEVAKEVQDRRAPRDKAFERLKRGDSVEKHELYSAIRSSELMELARAAQTFQDIGRKALGTDIERVDLSVSGQVEHAVSVSAELERDDVDRLAAFVAAAERAGLMGDLMGDVVDGEVVDDGGVAVSADEGPDGLPQQADHADHAGSGDADDVPADDDDEYPVAGTSIAPVRTGWR